MPARASVLVCLLIVSGVAQGAEDDLKVELLPASKHLKVGDPLLIKVLVTNNSPNVVKLPRKISSDHGTLHFEIQGPGETEFQHLISTTSPPLMTPPQWDELLKPNTTVASCEALYKADVDVLAFAKPGVYSIRVQVGIARTTLARSPAIDVTASARPEMERKSLERAGSLLQLFAADGSGGSNPTVYEQAAGEFRESQIKTTLLWKAAVARLRDARERDEINAARKAFDSLREQADPVTRDWMTLSLAGVYARAKNYQSAIAELDEIKDANTQKAQILGRISEQQREAFESKQRRQKQPAD